MSGFRADIFFLHACGGSASSLSGSLGVSFTPLISADKGFFLWFSNFDLLRLFFLRSFFVGLFFCFLPAIPPLSPLLRHFGFCLNGYILLAWGWLWPFLPQVQRPFQLALRSIPVFYFLRFFTVASFLGASVFFL